MYSSPSYSYSPLTTQGLMSLPVGFKQGGLAKMAQKVEAAGRNGDTMLAHITPEEAMMLRAMGGSGTINPETGLPEFFLKKIFKALAPILNKLAPILPFLPIPGLGPLSSLATKSLLTGIASGVKKDGSFDLKRGLTSGALSYGLGSLMANANAAGTGGPYDISDVGSLGDLGVSAPGAPVPDVGVPDVSALTPNQVGALSAPSAPSGGLPSDTGAGVYGGAPSDAMEVANLGVDEMAIPGKSSIGSPVQPAAPISPSSAPIPTGANPVERPLYESLSESVSEIGKALKPESFKDALKTAGYGLTAVSSGMSIAEQEKLRKEQEEQEEELKRKKAEDEKFARNVMAEFQPEFRKTTAEDIQRLNFAKGGIANLKKKPARFLKGKGDGMSDTIPATIDGKQKARLSDGEFVIPADVVSHLGNGSSQAGAKKLYDMMSRLRKARTGNGKQAPAVKAERYMPA